MLAFLMTSKTQMSVSVSTHRAQSDSMQENHILVALGNEDENWGRGMTIKGERHGGGG